MRLLEGLVKHTRSYWCTSQGGHSGVIRYAGLRGGVGWCTVRVRGREGKRLVQGLVHELSQSELSREGEVWGVEGWGGETEMRLVVWECW